MSMLMAKLSAYMFTVRCWILAEKEVSMDMDPFSYIKKNKVSDNTAIKGLGVSVFNLLIALAATGILMTIIICGIRLFGKGKSRQEGKSRLGIIILTGIAIFSFVFFANQILKIANNFI